MYSLLGTILLAPSICSLAGEIQKEFKGQRVEYRKYHFLEELLEKALHSLPEFFLQTRFATISCRGNLRINCLERKCFQEISFKTIHIFHY